MQKIIDPIDKELLKSELKEENFVRKTNKAGNEIYFINGNDAPNTMREIGRLREISFRADGGGSGKEYDIDSHDIGHNPYRQIVLWNPDEEEIIGGYRYKYGNHVTFLDNGTPDMAICHIFNLTEKFITDYLPYTLELGRAFIQPKYQSRQNNIKSIFALDNLWDGIGAVIAQNPKIKYLIGKVTIYSTTDADARKAMIYFLDKNFADKNNIIIPKRKETITEEDKEKYDNILNGDNNSDNLQKLKEYVKSRNEKIPPLIRSYLNLSSSPTTFGTVFDPDFGNIYDTGIMITLADVDHDKKERYIDSYLKTGI